MKQKKKGRKECEKNGVVREAKSERHCGKRRGLEGVSERPANHNVTSDSPYSRRQASTNEQSYKLITYQAERGE